MQFKASWMPTAWLSLCRRILQRVKTGKRGSRRFLETCLQNLNQGFDDVSHFIFFLSGALRVSVQEVFGSTIYSTIYSHARPHILSRTLWPVVKSLNVSSSDALLLPKLLQHARQTGNEPLIAYLFKNHQALRDKAGNQYPDPTSWRTFDIVCR